MSAPIRAVPTGVAGFVGRFFHRAEIGSVAVLATDGDIQLTATLTAQVVDEQGRLPSGDSSGAVAALTQAFHLRRSGVRNLRKLMELHGHQVTFAPGSMPPWPGLAPWLNLISVIFTWSICAFSAKRPGSKSPLPS